MVTGVYCIFNKATKKRYIGSAAKSLAKRIYSHRYSLNKNRHWNRYLQRAWNKYGSRAFVFSILEECEPSLCITTEQKWIDYYKSANSNYGYNLSPTAGSPLGVIHTSEVRAKLSAISKGKPKSPEHAAAIKRGKQDVSEETRRKMSESAKKRLSQHYDKLRASMKGNKRAAGRKLTEEHKRKLYEGRKAAKERKKELL